MGDPLRDTCGASSRDTAHAPALRPAGPGTCDGLVGSYPHYDQDAAYYAHLKADYVKVRQSPSQAAAVQRALQGECVDIAHYSHSSAPASFACLLLMRRWTRAAARRTTTARWRCTPSSRTRWWARTQPRAYRRCTTPCAGAYARSSSGCISTARAPATIARLAYLRVAARPTFPVPPPQLVRVVPVARLPRGRGQQLAHRARRALVAERAHQLGHGRQHVGLHGCVQLWRQRPLLRP